MVQLLSGATMAGPWYLSKSLFWLASAVFVKCAAFAIMEPRLPWTKAAWWMFLANLFSTIPGVLVAAFTASLTGILFALVLVYAIGWIVRKRVALCFGRHPPLWISGGGAALIFTVFFFVSQLLYELAGRALGEGGFTRYWILKFLFVTLTAVTGMLISVVLEEYLIARQARPTHGPRTFFKPVLRANYLMLIGLLLVAAWQTLPQRLRSPHLIISSERGLQLKPALRGQCVDTPMRRSSD
jgi:hypothetical protein